jgi:hypothetical protein
MPRENGAASAALQVAELPATIPVEVGFSSI